MSEMPDTPVSPRPPRKPPWFKVKLNTSESYVGIKKLVRTEGLHTVCEEARCPNLHECWGTHGTASFMILGDICTRRCRFCAVGTGLPLAVDVLEPLRVAASVMKMGLKHAHVTMVNRDDLPDGGASVVAATVRAIRARAPGCSVEVLTSDFMGSREAIASRRGERPGHREPQRGDRAKADAAGAVTVQLRQVAGFPEDREGARPDGGREVQHHAGARREPGRGPRNPR